MEIGINTYPYLWKCDVNEAFKQINKLGIRNVEILTSPPQFDFRSIDSAKREEILKNSKAYNINLVALNLPGQDINLASPFNEMREFTVDQYKYLIDISAEWGVPYVVMPPGRLHPLLPPQFEWAWGKAKPHIVELVEYAEQKNVCMLIENIPNMFFQRAEEIQTALNEIKSNHFKAIYDVSNAYMVEDPAEGIRRLGNEIKIIHLSDTTKKRWQHNVIGEGDVDFSSIFQALQEIKYDRYCILEIIHPEAEEGITTSINKLKEEHKWVF
ncbi:sugar phosphate isomerase/epimerase [Alkalihalobacillus oceani]|uniref:sugar phosphate isomerase/epimerase family protein n=1 Tax=Halalkalibacter oceani TaxID=1653776 RepID=UPI0020415059|nr:sugar phosphate isomerase/epimerase family protein [Halalkalibacter oceani]MCM3761341.1 sugar phosphate isomerase/epimerase [Halalkalibacter oceani]